MAGFIYDDVLDAALLELAEANLLTVTETYPTTREEAASTYQLGYATTIPGDGNGSFALDDAVDGRKLIMYEHADITVNVSGTATYLCFCDDLRLLGVFEIETPKAIYENDTFSTVQSDLLTITDAV